MTYELKFYRQAFKEWKKLDKSIQRQLKRKLTQRLIAPHVVASRLRGFESVYKIKLRSSGYRLVYQVKDEEIVVLVVVIAKRDRGEVYKKARERLM